MSFGRFPIRESPALDAALRQLERGSFVLFSLFQSGETATARNARLNNIQPTDYTVDVVEMGSFTTLGEYSGEYFCSKAHAMQAQLDGDIARVSSAATGGQRLRINLTTLDGARDLQVDVGEQVGGG
jgi:hypothetical protein